MMVMTLTRVHLNVDMEKYNLSILTVIAILVAIWAIMIIDIFA
jgi:hypothetical protein